MTPNVQLKDRALNALEGKWLIAVATYFIYSLMTGGVSSVPYIGWIVIFIVGGPLSVGLAGFSLSLARKQEARIEQLFDGFKNFAANTFAFIMVTVIVIFGFILLIVPGVIFSLAYSQTFYLLAEDPTLTAQEAMQKSWRLMQGKKAKLFWLGLSFIGWILLSILTLFIGLLWLMPYMYVTYAQFYDDIREQPVVVTEAQPVV